MLDKIFFYGLGRIAPRAISFFLLPVYTAFIDPEGWGVLSLMWITADLAGLALSCQLPQAVFRRWASTGSEPERRRLTGLALTAPLLLSTLLFLPAYLLADEIAAILGVPDFGPYVRLYTFAVQLGLVLEGVQADMRVREEAKLYAVLDAGQRITQAVLNVYFLVACGLGLRGLVLSQLLTCSAAILLFLPRTLRRVRLNLDLELFRKLLRFSLPLVPSAVAMGLVHNVDRYFLEALRDTEEVGVYSVGYKLGTIVNLAVLGPFFLSWEPKSYEIAGGPEGPARVGRVFTCLAAVLVLFAAGFFGAAEEIVRVLTSPEYWGASSVLPWVVLSYVFFGLDSVARVGLLYRHRTRTVLGVVLVACASNVAANALLIPARGMVGAAQATLLSFVLLFALDLWLGQKQLRPQWEWRKLAAIVAAGATAAGAMRLVDTQSLLLDVLLDGLALLLYPLLLWLLGFFRGMGYARR